MSAQIMKTRLQSDQPFQASSALGGTSRSKKQDAVYRRLVYLDDRLPVGLFIVCDGFGANDDGKIASSIAIKTVQREITQAIPCLNRGKALKSGQTIVSPDELPDWLSWSVRRANWNICDTFSQRPNPVHAGTTLAAVVLVGHQAFFAHAGDTRIYLSRKGQLRQLTEDHTLAGAFASSGIISWESIPAHPRRKVLLRALGTRSVIDFDQGLLTLQPGDRLLICSDGVWASFDTPDEIQALICDNKTLNQRARAIVWRALRNNGSDDAGVVLLEYG